MKARVLLVGAGGQLGRELVRLRWPHAEMVPYSSEELDITNAKAVELVVESVKPDAIINAAAYTAVDAAEDEPDRAMAVNALAVENLAAAANEVDALLVQVSTDYVFDGSKNGWYTEADQTAPLGSYGRSKVAGERAAARARRSVVLRTSWLYGALGSSFVTTILRLASERDDLGVVDDQFGCPTAAGDLAVAIRAVVDRSVSGRAAGRSEVRATTLPRGLYHAASPEDASWHEFALAVLGASASGFDGTCRALSTAEFPTKAQRPANSRLDSTALAKDFGLVLPSWRKSLPAVVAELEA